MSRALNLLALVLLALGALYFVVSTGDRGRVSSDRLVSMHAEEVARIEIIEPARTIMLERRPTGWRLTQPVDYPAVPEFAESAVNVLTTMVSKGVISANPEKAHLFGLAVEKAIHVRLYAEEESAPRVTVQVGKLAQGINFTYVKVGESDQVHQVAGSARIQLTRSVYGWRSKQMIGFDPEALERVTFDGKKSVTITRDGGDWQWAEEMKNPPGVQPDGANVNSLLALLSRMQAAGFVDEPVVGEGPPLLAISMRAVDGETATDLVVEAEQDGRYRVVVDANPQRFLIPKARLEQLIEDPVAALTDSLPEDG